MSGNAAWFDPAIALLDGALAVVPNDSVLLHYKGYALFRKATLLPGRTRDISAALDNANRALESSAKTLDWAETFALRASVYGRMIGTGSNPITAMRLGRKSDREMERAAALDPTNPRVFLLRGIGSIYKPRMFGGGLDKAEKDLKKALALFPEDKATSPAPVWGYAEAWAWLGQVYLREHRLDDARAAYVKALEVQPGYGWVTHTLLPELAQKKR